MGPAAVPWIIGAGLGMQAIGSIQQGMAAAQEAKAQAAMAEYNAKVAKQQAEARRNAARFEQERQAKAGERVRSGLQAQFGASGGVPSEGVPLMIEAEQVAENELENLLIGYEGEIDAQRSEIQAKGYKMQSDIYSQRASTARTAGFIGAGTSILSGFGNYAMKKWV